MFFVTTKTANGRALLQSDRNAALLVDVLRSCVGRRLLQVNDFVIMPNHLHLLITISSDMTVERAMQFIKGGFSFRLKRETGYCGEVWQKGFSDARIRNSSHLAQVRNYIAQNPARAGIVKAEAMFAWCYESLRRQKLAGSSENEEPAARRNERKRAFNKKHRG